MKFSVGRNVRIDSRQINLGVASGRFDAKQVVLTALVIMLYATKNKFVHVVRTIERNQLEKCDFFVTDGFASKFPTIPSFNNIPKVWEKYGEEISNFLIPSADSSSIAACAAKKVSEIEKFDILLEYNTTMGFSNEEGDLFEKAVNVAITLIKQIIKSAAKHAMAIYTIKRYIEECDERVLYLPLNVDARDIVQEIAPHIKWVITKEDEDVFLVEAINKEIDIRQVVKDRKEAIYAGRFFCKVTSYEVARKIVEVIEEKTHNIA